MGIINKWIYVQLMKQNDNKLFKKQKTFGNINIRADVQYVLDGEREHRLDIVYPAENSNGKTILYIHGGSYIYGYKEVSIIFTSYFASQGFTVVAMNYRLADAKKGVTIKEQIEDVFSVLEFMRKNRVYYNFNTENMAIMGDSAGGHLSLLTNIIFHSDECREYYGIKKLPDVKIKCYALNSPMYDYPALVPQAVKILTKSLIKDIFSTQFEDKEYLKLNSPRYYMRKSKLDLEPIFASTSYHDFYNQQTLRLDKDAKELGYNVDMLYEASYDKNIGHVYNHFVFENEGKVCNDKMIEFINKYTND